MQDYPLLVLAIRLGSTRRVVHSWLAGRNDVVLHRQRGGLLAKVLLLSKYLICLFGVEHKGCHLPCAAEARRLPLFIVS